MKRQNKFFWGLGAIACLFSILVSCSQPVAPPLRVGTNPWTGYEPLYLAQELNYYKDKSIQIVNYPSLTESNRAYRNGEIEVVALTLDVMLLTRQTEPNISAFLITDISNGADVLLAKPQISDLKSLKGKRVGVETNALGAYILTRALQKAKLSPKDIEIVSLAGIAEHEQAYKQGKIDAIVTYEPGRSKLIGAGAKLLFDSSQIPNEVVDVLVARQDLLQSRSDAFRALTEGWFRALEYMKQNPEDAISRMATKQEVTPKELSQALKLLHIPDVRENQKLLSQADPSLQQGAKRLTQVMVEQNLLQQAVNLDSILTDSVVKNLQ